MMVAGLLAIILPGSGVAQEMAATGYNPHSIHPVHKSDIMFKKTIWRRIDLTEKQNRPFFAYNNEITKIIIEAVKAGILHPYLSDSLTTRMTKAQFLENLQLPDAGTELTEEEKAMGFTEEDSGWGDGSGWGDAGWGDTAWDEDSTVQDADEEASEMFLPSEVSVMVIKEDMIFDKKRSDMFFDIQSIELIIPAHKFETGLYRPIGVFSYKDLVSLFKSMPEEAVWYNPYNSAAHLNLADAFALRLFSGRIIKVSNPRDLRVSDIYASSRKEGLIRSRQIEMELLEFEHNLWVY